MPITISQAETMLVRDFDFALVACGLSPNPATDASPRAYLANPLYRAIDDQGVPVADPTAPADAEVGAVADVARLVDVAGLILLQTLCAKFIQVTWSTNVQKQDLNAYRADLLKQLADRRDYVRRVHGFGRGRLGAATIDLGFVQTGWPSGGCE